MAHRVAFEFPLRDVTELQLQSLCQVLWNWYFCGNCSSTQPCAHPECFRRKLPRLELFFEFYRETTYSYVPESLYPDDEPAMRCHEDLFDIIRLLKESPLVARDELTKEYFASRVEENRPPLNDQHRAFNIAIKIMTSVNCSTEGQSCGVFETGLAPSTWRSDQSAADFISFIFPKRDHPSLSETDESSPDIKSEMTAMRLDKIAGLKFVGTNDLRNHLKLDQTSGVVEIYHHTSFLKEHLKSSKTGSGMGNVLPRQLALETLDSLQRILFPLESRSQAYLRSLVSRQSLDPDCLRFGSSTYRHDHENDVSYQYWGSRLMDLYDELENPKPRKLWDIWLERKSKARHVMLATLVGIIIAIILGVLGLVVGIMQTWISYQAWKHPVNIGDP